MGDPFAYTADWFNNEAETMLIEVDRKLNEVERKSN
jgi:hypothetical protein